MVTAAPAKYRVKYKINMSFKPGFLKYLIYGY